MREPWWRQADAEQQLKAMLKEILAAVREQRQKESMRLGVEREEMMSWYLVVTGGGMEVEVFLKYAGTYTGVAWVGGLSRAEEGQKTTAREAGNRTT